MPELIPHARILRTPEAARYLGISAKFLALLRVTGGGPRFMRLGAKAVGYDYLDLRVD